MNNIRRIQYFLFCLLAIGLASCSDDDNNDKKTGYEGILTELAAEVDATTQQLWGTSPSIVNTERADALSTIQGYADKCLDDYFISFLNGFDQASMSMEKSEPILYYYRSAFDRVMYGIENSKVENGTAEIWLLYNMGYIVKTPSGCFAIDISHRWAKELAPYIDFLCVTHKHSDHYNTDLIQAMFDLDKPVLSNYLKDTTYPYTAKGDKDYEIGKFKIRTCITDHNNSGLSNFVTIFQIDCGDDTGNFVFMHVGDSNFKTEQYTNIAPHVNVLIPRYAPNALTENNILGTGAGQVQPDYVLLSHILEMAHAGVDASRWSLDMALERASKINCDQTYVPMWGEKMVWKNGKLN